jgi:uncharacterized phiE125 gp8 family phage protein
MALTLTTAPSTEPVTLAEARLHLRLDDDFTADDDLIEVLIQTARESAEHETGRALITQMWERSIDAFPEVEIELGKPSVIAITSVIYIDTAGDSQTMDAANYSLDSTTDGGFLLPAVDTTWPETMDTANAVRVRFTTGFGDASAVPAAVKTWILLRVAALYAGGDGSADTMRMQPMFDRLLDRWRFFG